MKVFKILFLVVVALILVYTLHANLPFYIPNELQKEGEILLTTHWTGSGPYAAFTPEPEDNTLGCWSTSFSQIMYYHKLKPVGKVFYNCSRGYTIDVNLDEFSFDWNKFSNMITLETPDSVTNEIAKYCYSIATIVQKDFGTGRYMTMMPSKNFLEEHLAVKTHLYLMYKGWLQGKRKIRNLVIHEIEAGRPVFFYYRNMKVKGSGHSVVIDGYRFENKEFLVHLNFGWGGEKDGWFPMFEDIAIDGDKNLRFWITVNPVTNEN